MKPRAVFWMLGTVAAIAVTASACQGTDETALVVGLRAEGQTLQGIHTIEVLVEELIPTPPPSETVIFVAPVGTRWTIPTDGERTLGLTFADSVDRLRLEVTVLGDLGKLASRTVETATGIGAGQRGSVPVTLIPVVGAP